MIIGCGYSHKAISIFFSRCQKWLLLASTPQTIHLVKLTVTYKIKKRKKTFFLFNMTDKIEDNGHTHKKMVTEKQYCDKKNYSI